MRKDLVKIIIKIILALLVLPNILLANPSELTTLPAPVCERCEGVCRDKTNGDYSCVDMSSGKVAVGGKEYCSPCGCGFCYNNPSNPSEKICPVVEGLECNDGNLNNNDGCDATCQVEECGDGIKNLPGEECDDGNKSDNDECVCTCKNAVCGDGYVYTGKEECDDGNKDNTDSCTELCKAPVCGDGYKQAGEDCDDGNTVDTDNCSNSCKAPKCGDGVKAGSEQCDDGNNNNYDGCTCVCELSKCGDGFAELGKEECDDGNTNNNDNCTNKCELAECGDGIVNKPLVCGPFPGVYYAPGTNHCLAIAPAEECDDGNDVDTDDCRNSCVRAKCGDGVKAGSEQCDDGNTNENDDCTNSCKNAKCGDGIVQTGETCDDSNTVNNDGCTNACKLPECGDSIVQTGEECDNGKTGDDTCDASCKLICKYYKFSDGATDKFVQAQDFDLNKLSCMDKIWGTFGNINQSKLSVAQYSGYTYKDQNLRDDNLTFLFALWIDGRKDEVAKLLTSYQKLYAHYNSTGGANTLSEENLASAKKDFIDVWGIRSDIFLKYFSIDNGRYHLKKNVFFDKDCKPHFDITEKVCGSALVGGLQSPISLELEGKVDDAVAVVNFALKPDETKWVIWKASDKAPLLVYDPQHTGVVKDGSQLFGNWTFGGKISDFKNVAMREDRSIASWKSGYEALEILDNDQDGYLRGSELEHIALWFDANRNAVSEPGEVRDIRQSGIVELNVKSDFVAKNNDISSSLGFKRHVNNDLEVGSSVDWFSGTFDSQIDAIQSLNKTNSASLEKQDQDLPAPLAKNLGKDEFTGAWLWKSEAKVQDVEKPFGILMLFDFGDKVRGLSMVEQRLAKNSDGYKSYLVTGSLEGNKIQRNGKSVLEFQVNSEGILTSSVAELDGAGKLIGKSKMSIENTAKTGGVTELTYNWQASK